MAIGRRPRRSLKWPMTGNRAAVTSSMIPSVVYTWASVMPFTDTRWIPMYTLSRKLGQDCHGHAHDSQHVGPLVPQDVAHWSAGHVRLSDDGGEFWRILKPHP